jgi:proteasome lid subunit RPN8/RPN11
MISTVVAWGHSWPRVLGKASQTDRKEEKLEDRILYNQSIRPQTYTAWTEKQEDTGNIRWREKKDFHSNP